MSLRKSQQETGKGGALVLASSPVLAARHFSPQTGETSMIVTARSVFLAQLSSQYESKSAASARRMDARVSASNCYSEKAPEPRLRHLVWA